MRSTNIDLLEDFVPRLPTAAECSFAQLLHDRARHAPDDLFAVFADGLEWSNGAAWGEVASAAARLRAAGIGKGDRVIIWMPNGPSVVRLLFACFCIGAVAVPINTAYRGSILEHVIRTSEARLLLAHPQLADRLNIIAVPALTRVLALGDDQVSGGFEAFDRIEVDGASPGPVTNEAWDDAIVIFTSGTTGPSKGVITSYAQQWTVATVQYAFAQSSDRVLVMMPLFHISGLGGLLAAVVRGGTIVVMEPVSPTRFWGVVRKTGATLVSGFPTGMIDLLLKQPEAEDQPHTLRVFSGSIVDQAARDFGARFGLDLIARYSMSETSGITSTTLNPTSSATIGRPRPGVELRLVDEWDRQVPAGEVGEIILRSDVPWTLSSGYLGDPASTMRAWRNGWFHTGDLARQNVDGEYVFVDRKKDAVRRRGENISAWEVENEARRFAGVAQAAVVGVEDRAGGGEEVLVVVESAPGIVVEPAAFTAHMIKRLPHFMVPRYVRILDRLPQTETGKIRKADLRELGLLDSDWDREAHGFKVRRLRIGEGHAR